MSQDYVCPIIEYAASAFLYIISLPLDFILAILQDIWVLHAVKCWIYTIVAGKLN